MGKDVVGDKLAFDNAFNIQSVRNFDADLISSLKEKSLLAPLKNSYVQKPHLRQIN